MMSRSRRREMRNVAYFGLALLALLCTAKPSCAQDIATESKKDYDFASLKRFAWKTNHLITNRRPEDNKVLDQKIMRTITQELASKGLVEDSSDPEFYLFYHAGPGDEGLMAGAAAPAGLESIQPPDTGGPNLVGGPSVGFAPNVWYSVQGKFVFYALDSHSNVVVWQCTATKRWYDPKKARKNEDKEIQKIVDKSFKNFPPKSKK